MRLARVPPADLRVHERPLWLSLCFYSSLKRTCSAAAEFDEGRARVFGTPAEIELDLKRGDTAFADAVAQGD